jgi:hypothetical protein
MTKAIPIWILNSYAKLWIRFKEERFDFSKAEDVLKKLPTSVILSFLKKRDWLQVSLNPNDSRKRLYTLKNPEQAITEMGQDE